MKNIVELDCNEISVVVGGGFFGRVRELYNRAGDLYYEYEEVRIAIPLVVASASMALLAMSFLGREKYSPAVSDEYYYDYAPGGDGCCDY